MYSFWNQLHSTLSIDTISEALHHDGDLPNSAKATHHVIPSTQLHSLFPPKGLEKELRHTSPLFASGIQPFMQKSNIPRGINEEDTDTLFLRTL